MRFYRSPNPSYSFSGCQAAGFYLDCGLLVLKATERLETVEWEESRLKYLKAHCSYWDSAIFVVVVVVCLINIPELL